MHNRTKRGSHLTAAAAKKKPDLPVTVRRAAPCVVPQVPEDIPQPVADLIRDCWAERPADRPGFDDVLVRLSAMDAIHPSPSRAAARQEALNAA